MYRGDRFPRYMTLVIAARNSSALFKLFIRAHLSLTVYAYRIQWRLTAQRWVNSIAGIEKRLRMAPESFPLEPFLPNNPRQYRGASLMMHFRLIHYYDKSRNVVRIMRIWDSRMNPKRLLEELQ